MKKILLIGGGTGGHIFPLRNLATELLKKKAFVELIVADAPLDRKIVKENFTDIPVTYFDAGKIRRYLCWQNIKDAFKIIPSCWKAKKILKKINPDIIFFKGGFVGFPFLIASKYLLKFKGEIYAHESDISPGIMTRLARKHADKVFESFDTENPRPLFYEASLESKNKKTKMSDFKKYPHILLFGGSQGAEFINKALEKNLPLLASKYKITLVTGPDKRINAQAKYFTQYEFLPAQKLSKLIQESDLIISRAGANSLFEIIAAKKPSIIIPLPSVARNHQMLNAQFFAKKNLCYILPQNTETSSFLPIFIDKTLSDEKLKKALSQSKIKNSAKDIAHEITKE